MQPDAQPPIAEFRATTKMFGEVGAARDLNLSIRKGEFLSFLGPSGCGKTTALRMLAGFEAPTSGDVLIDGERVNDLPAHRRPVNMVFQHYALFPHLDVTDNISYGLRQRRPRPAAAEVAQAVEQALETVRLPGYGRRRIWEMSGGQQQRVAVARALVLEPEVLLFDEPLSNLDARLRRSMREEIRALQQRLGLTVVYVTHDQAEALAVSDKIVVMRNAEIAQAGTPEELYTQPASVFVATFMGEANHVRAAVESIDGPTATVVLGGERLALPHRGTRPGPVDLVIRPEAIRISDSGQLSARVSRATYMGSHTEYYFSIAAGELFAVGADRLKRRAPGEQVMLALDPEGVVLVQP